MLARFLRDRDRRGLPRTESSAGVNVRATTSVERTPITASQPNSRIAPIGEITFERNPATVVSPVRSTASQTTESVCSTASREFRFRSSRSAS